MTIDDALAHFSGLSDADLKDADFNEHDLSQAVLDRTEQLPAAKGVARELDIAKMTGAHEMVRCQSQDKIRRLVCAQPHTMRSCRAARGS